MREANTNRQASSQAGFTLLETLFAGAIMTVVSLGTISLFAYSNGYNTGGSNRALAMMVCQKQMEQFRNVPFTDASLNATSGAKSTVSCGGEQFIVTTTIVDTSSTLKTITIQVGFTARFAGVANAVTLVTQRSANQAGPNLGP